MPRSDQYKPLPRAKGQPRLYRSPGGGTVSEHFVRTLRSKERGFTSPKAETRAKKSEAFRHLAEEAAGHSGLKKREVSAEPTLNRDFARAFVRSDGSIRSWQEAEEHCPRAVGRLLVDAGRITQAQYYLYFADRRGPCDTKKE